MMRPMQAFFIFLAVLALYGTILEIMLPFIDSLPLVISELKAPLEFQAQTISFCSSAISFALIFTVSWMAIFFMISLVLYGAPKTEKEQEKRDRRAFGISYLLLWSPIAKDAILYRSQDDLSFEYGVLARLRLVYNDSAVVFILPTIIFALVIVYRSRRQGRVKADDEESRLALAEMAKVDSKKQQPEFVDEGGVSADAVV